MTSIGGKDDRLHHSDGSHRWIAPVRYSQDAWNRRLREHLDEHRKGLDVPARGRCRLTDRQRTH